MNIALWVAAGLPAVVFAGAGVAKLTTPKEKLAQNKNTAYAEDLPAGLITLIGGLELAGALGLILPWATGIAPVLTPLAAVGLALVMVGAVVTHARRKETTAIVLNLVIGAIAGKARPLRRERIR